MEYRLIPIPNGTEIFMRQDSTSQWWWIEPPFDDKRGPYPTADACEDAVVEWVMYCPAAHTGDTE